MATPKVKTTRAAPRAHYVHRIISATSEAERNAFALSNHPLVLHAVATLRQVRQVLCGEAAWNLIAQRGLSVKEAAAVLQVSRSTAQRWLNTALTYHTAHDQITAPTKVRQKGCVRLVVNNA